ncbi:MAG: hypothetical protein KC464_01990, partial [Myxococcales bacterium]|nr:hypothetical protein [Myxococcales bacterium]
MQDHRNPDKLNIIGVVTVGICGAVLVYVSIIALQAFYMNDTSAEHAQVGFTAQTDARNSLKASQLSNVGEYRRGAEASTFKVPVERAMELVVRDAMRDPANLIPGHPSTTSTILPVYGRP